MRYQLMVDGATRNPVFARSKKEIEEWIEAKLQDNRLDYRVGYMVKFRGDKALYEWVMTSTGNRIRT